MAMRTKALVWVGAATAALFVIGLQADLFWLRIASKPWPILCFIVWVLSASRDRYARLVAAGLGASLAGDLLLEGGANLFLPGLAAFLAAHMLYVAAYLVDERAPRLARLVPFGAFGLGAFLLLRPGLGRMTMPVAVYITAISVMMWRAAARVGRAGAPVREEWLALGGAVLFASSDSLIAIQRFVLDEHSPGLRYPIILLYWAGQLGITLSVRRPRRPLPPRGP